VNVDPHAAPSGPALFITSATAVLALFLIAWCYVGAAWLLPLREAAGGHKCHPALFTVSYVVVLSVIAGSILIAMASAALACCGCLFAAAVGTAVRSFIDATLAYVGLAAPHVAGTGASPQPAVPAPPATSLPVEDAEYPEVQPAAGSGDGGGGGRSSSGVERVAAAAAEPSSAPTSTVIAVPAPA
jgi:hypothetical protein